MPAAFEEIEPPVFTVNERGEFHGRRVFLIDFLDTAEFFLDLYGGWNVTGGSAFLYPPQHFPNVIGAVCIGFEAVGWPDDSPQATTLASLASPVTNYPKAKVTATYGPEPNLANTGGGLNSPSIPDGTFLRVSGQTSAEFVTLPGTSLRWVSDNVALGEDANVGVWLGSTEQTWHWMRVPLPPWTSMKLLPGGVNDTTFLGFGAGLVLYTGSGFEREFTINAQTQWSIFHNFKIRSQPWNFAFRTGVGWVEYERDDNLPSYPKVSLTPLFAFG
jgi:hypothetical protein